MSIISANSTSTPMPSYGALSAFPDDTSYYAQQSTASKGTVVSSTGIIQIVGLVPVFPCCNETLKDATGNYHYTDFDSGTSTIDLVINSIDYGTYIADGLDTNAQVKAKIDALLIGTGITVVVTGAGLNRVVTLTAPSGSGSLYNGYDIDPVVTVGGATITSITDFNGGVDDTNTPGCDCREGKYKADTISDDRQFPLPVFALHGQGTNPDPYFNDFNSFLFDATPTNNSNTMTFYLDKLINNIYVTQATLNNNTYGTFFAKGSLCANLLWQGFNINWSAVITALGEGTYRFRVATNLFGKSGGGCFASPPFCLKAWDCYAVDRTAKFEVTYSGGRIGNIDKKNCGGGFWDFCCITTIANGTKKSNPITWQDSLRLGSYFGDENWDKERNTIKYPTGVVNRIRNEAISKFTWMSTAVPHWMHARLAVYAFNDSDTTQLLLSDYNINNPEYDLKRFCVEDDGNYAPDYKKYSRYSKVKVNFKAAVQYQIRTRCC